MPTFDVLRCSSNNNKRFKHILQFWKDKDALTKYNKSDKKSCSKSSNKSSNKKSNKCNDIRPKPKELFKNKLDRRQELRKRCNAQGQKINKNCKVPNTKILVCHESKSKK